MFSKTQSKWMAGAVLTMALVASLLGTGVSIRADHRYFYSGTYC